MNVEMNRVFAMVQRLGEKLVRETKDATEGQKRALIMAYLEDVRKIVMRSKLPEPVKQGYFQAIEERLGR